MTDTAQVEQRADLVKAQSIEVGAVLGGVAVSSMADLAKISDLLSRGEIAVPTHCRGKPGVCFALAMQALEWRIPIMSVINKSYVPRGGDRIGYESQLLHAVVEKNAPLKNRLRYEILGEGNQRRCKVWGTFKGEDRPHEYTTETLEKMHPGHVEKDGKTYVRGSSLWDTTPEVQMFYSASRQWARLFCPDVLLGAYAVEELEAAQPMVDVTPKISDFAQRLKDARAANVDGRGFDVEHVAREAAARNSIIEGDTDPGAAQQEVTHEDANRRGNETGDEERQDRAGAGAVNSLDQGGGAGAGGVDQTVGAQPAGQTVATKGKGKILTPGSKPKAKGKR